MNLRAIDASRLLENMPCGIAVHAPDTKVLYVNDRTLDILRMSRAQIEGRDVMDPQWRFIRDDGTVLAAEDYPVNKVISSGKPVANEVIGVIDGSRTAVTWILVNGFPEFDSSGELSQVVLLFIDVSLQRRAIDFEQIVARASDAVIVTEATPIDLPGPRIVYVNEAFTKISGYSSEEVVGETPRIMQGPRTDPLARERIRTALENKEPVHEMILNYAKDGTEYWLDLTIHPLYDIFGNLSYYAAIERDLTDLKVKQLELMREANIDPLTGLANRRGFASAARPIIANADRAGFQVVVLMLDIDHFKQINDEYGHDAGDLALTKLGEMLSSSLRDGDLTGRFGGEEFAILLANVDEGQSLRVAEKLRGSISELDIALDDGRSINFTISIGASAIRGGEDLGNALTRADAALYQAKNGGRNRVCVVPAVPD